MSHDGEEAAAQEDARPRPKRGDELELQIESLAFGGEGVARLGDSGYVVFVAGAIPGDRVRAVVHKRKRSYAHARTLEVLEPSPERIEPLADHPGVPWQVLPYERQLEVKRAQVDDALRRIGRLDGYRARGDRARRRTVALSQQARVLLRRRRPAGSSCAAFTLRRGEPGGADRADCLLASERGNLAREVALRWCREQGLDRVGARRGRGAGAALHRAAARGGSRSALAPPAADGRARLRNLVVREGRRTGKLQVRIVTTEGELEAGLLAAALSEALGRQPQRRAVDALAQPRRDDRGRRHRARVGRGRLPERLGELDLLDLPEAFFQTNTEMAELLYGVVVEYAALEGWERVYDLYCGIGTIALTLAPRAGELWGIELLEEAVADAIAGASRNEITKAQFFAGDVRLAMPELLERAGRPDLVVVDPPRAGLSKKVVHRIIDASPKRIVYVSCNPTTLAPNAAELVQAGWVLRKVRPVDMFPQTHHIECVALFERGEGAAPPSG
jgi:23S rRNA (uracil1939-C5)-methyltransferase